MGRAFYTMLMGLRVGTVLLDLNDVLSLCMEIPRIQLGFERTQPAVALLATILHMWAILVFSSILCVSCL